MPTTGAYRRPTVTIRHVAYSELGWSAVLMQQQPACHTISKLGQHLQVNSAGGLTAKLMRSPCRLT